MLKLLPARREINLVQRRGALTERQLQKHDAAIIACEHASDRKDAEAQLSQLPLPASWLRLYREARSRGPVSLLAARVTPAAVPMVVVFVKSASTKFELLTLAGRAWKELLTAAPQHVLLGIQGMDSSLSGATLEALTSAALAGSALMPTFKSRAAPARALETITLIHQGAHVDLRRAAAMDRGNHLARYLTSLPPNVLDTHGYRRALRALAQQQRWDFKFLDETALKRLGAGAFLAVSRANDHRGAGIVRLRYRASSRTHRRGNAVPRVTLVGKGICFDTGGINLKSHKSMYLMHEDMQGSAVALGTLLALSELQVPFDIDCWLALTENEIGSRAYRPQEVVTACNGVTIQVVHSDAEGRMVLADTLALAARDRPDLIIDFSTLTGACVTALTERYSGAFTNRSELRATLELAGHNSGERVWPFPMDEDFDSDLDSTIADIVQCTPDSKGDHILAARFLNRFVPADVPWVHLDLAASNRSGGLAHIPTDFTGFGVRFASHLLLDHGLPGKRSNSGAGKLTARRRR